MLPHSLLLLLLAITTSPLPTLSSPHPPPPHAQHTPSPSPTSITGNSHRHQLHDVDDSQLLPNSNQYHIPIYHRPHRRAFDSSALREWALRESDRVRTKYAPLIDGGGTNSNSNNLGTRGLLKKKSSSSSRGGKGLVERAVSSSSSSSTSTSTAAGSNSTAPASTDPVGFVRLGNYDSDLEYFAQVGMGGYPIQYLDVVLDTGSADLWLVSSSCTSCGNTTSLSSSSNSSTSLINSFNSSSTPAYNPSLSPSATTSQTPFSVKYGSGSASGLMYKDYTGFGGFNISNQSFAVVTSVSSGLLSGGLGGIMGLGWQALSASATTPFWQNLFNAGVLPFPGFGFALTRYINQTSAPLITPGGSLTIGYLNTTLFDGDVNYVDIPTGLESYWVIAIDSVGVGQWSLSPASGSSSSSSASSSGSSTSSSSSSTTSSTSTSSSTGTRTSTSTSSSSSASSTPYVNITNVDNVDGTLVAVDTGTTLIGGPGDVVDSIYALITGSQKATGAYTGYYSFPCATRVNITLGFGGNVYKIAPDDFNLGPFGVNGNVSTCLGAFFDLSLSSNSKISWVVGAAFLKNVYSIYRASPASVGFASLSNGISNRTMQYNSSSSATATHLPIIPGGIFGPSGGLGNGSSTMTPGITTAIQAGQTVSTVSNGAVGRVGVEWSGVVVGLVLGMGILLA